MAEAQKIRVSSVMKRRGILASVTALGVALVAKLSTTDRVEAADGDNMRVGVTNNANAATALVVGVPNTGLFVQTPGGRTIYAVNSGGGTTILAQGSGASGVQGESSGNAALIGSSGSNAGVYGQGRYGVWGQGLGAGSTGVYGAVGGGGSIAGLFDGPVTVNGPVTVTGPLTVTGDFGATGMKSAIVKNRRGADVHLFSIEAPESYFEDFGASATGSDGSVFVDIAEDFRDVIKTAQYLVFLTAYGRNSGLFIEEQRDNGFKVRDSANIGSVGFAWRVVAKRGDLDVQRFHPASSEIRGPRVDRIKQPDLVQAPRPDTAPPPPDNRRISPASQPRP